MAGECSETEATNGICSFAYDGSIRDNDLPLHFVEPDIVKNTKSIKNIMTTNPYASLITAAIYVSSILSLMKLSTT